jgi:steroid 5-alpha reductase family enzyme
MVIYLWVLLGSVLINLFFFVFASAWKTDKFTDFTYGFTFAAISLFLLFFNQTFYAYQIILAAMVIIWAARLVTYLVIRILRIKKDNRFNKMRGNVLAFLQFWIFQGLAVWVIMLPVIYVLSSNQPYAVSPLMGTGIFIWFTGLAIETVADWQKFRFKNKPQNKNKWIESGLWRYSRHPNYFGEMLLWWGVFVYSWPLLQGWGYLTVIGPLFISYILIFVSGIPPLEKRYKEKYKNNKQYLDYRRKTSLLIPSRP